MKKSEFDKKIKTGWFRRKYGLDTSKGSQYFVLRQNGMSDFDAQSKVFEKYLNESIIRKLIREEIQRLNEVAGFNLSKNTKSQIIEFLKKNVQRAKEIKGYGRIEQDNKYDIFYYGSNSIYAKWENNELYINDTAYGNVSQTFLDFFEKVAKKMGISYKKKSLDKR